MSIPTTYQAPVGRPVRMPFRVLAAFVGVLAVVAVLGTPFLIWRGVRVLAVGDVIMLPMTAWFMRLMLHAAVRGKSPADAPWWPLASPGVWNYYIVLLLIYWVLKP
jgi:hypothetical protein